MPDPAAAPVLIVEDDVSLAQTEQRLLSRAGIESVIVPSVPAAIDALKSGRHFQSVLLDYKLPGGTPWDVLEIAQTLPVPVPVVLTTGMGDEALVAEAFRQGIADYLPKPEGIRGRLVPTLRRVAERQAAEARLAESEARFRGAFETAAHGMAIVSTDGRWLEVNPAVCAMTGYSEAELLAIDFQTITHPEDLESDLDQVRALLKGRIRSYQLEKRYFHKDGHIIWIVLAVSLVRGPDGLPSYFVSQMQDITAQKVAEEARRRSEQRFNLVVQGITEYAVYMLDAGGRVATWNTGAQRIKGYRPEEAVRHW